MKISQVEYQNQERSITAVIEQRIKQFQLEPFTARSGDNDEENKDLKEELDLL